MFTAHCLLAIHQYLYHHLLHVDADSTPTTDTPTSDQTTSSSLPDALVGGVVGGGLGVALIIILSLLLLIMFLCAGRTKSKKGESMMLRCGYSALYYSENGLEFRVTISTIH